MAKHNIFIWGLFLCLAGKLTAEPPMMIRLYSAFPSQKAIITVDSVPWYLLAFDEDLRLIDTIYDLFPEDGTRTLYLEKINDQIQVRTAREDLGYYAALRLASAQGHKEFRIASRGIERAYLGELQIRPYRDYLQIVNLVPLEDYVAGVVESESRPEDKIEYYKAQAVLARTYAIRNISKHYREGYHLKDDVSSQVYQSKCHYTYRDMILKAVADTRDTIIATRDKKPILSAFHANSGGQTAGAEDAWLKPVDYLQSRKDSFSVGVGSYRWEKKVLKSRFYAYFARYLGVSNNEALHQALLDFKQNNRKSHFTYAGRSIKLTAVRRDFQLRSTFFSVHDAGNYVLLKGYGYGHGVGLSQDGALKMAAEGFSYKKILYFYFENVELISLQNLKSET